LHNINSKTLKEAVDLKARLMVNCQRYGKITRFMQISFEYGKHESSVILVAV